MTDQLSEKLSLFTANARALKKDFIWQEPMAKRLAALLYTLENRPVNCEAVRDCYALLKEQTGVFSTFRGTLSIYISAMLSLSEQPEQRLRDTLAVYELLKEQKFYASDYLVAAAYQVAANARWDRYREVAGRARGFYDAMKANHRFRTGQDDYIFAAMLGLSDLDVRAASDRMEQLYQKLKPKFLDGNSVQALTQVLVLGGETDEAVSKLFQLRGMLRDSGIKLDKTYTLPSLGLLALLPVDGETLADEIWEARNYLRAPGGFGSLTATEQELLLYAAALAGSVCADGMKSGVVATVSTSVTSMIIAQQIAMMTAMMAATTAGRTAAASTAH